MPSAIPHDYCSKCGRTGLTRDDFPKSAKGYVYNWCLRCEQEKCQRWRDALTADPEAHTRHRQKERERLRRHHVGTKRKEMQAV